MISGNIKIHKNTIDILIENTLKKFGKYAYLNFLNKNILSI